VAIQGGVVFGEGHYRGAASRNPAIMPDNSDSSGPTHASGALLNLLIDSPNLDAFLDQVVRLAAEVVSPTAACGMTVRRDGRPFTVSSSDDLAAQVDEIQYGADEGPCLESLRNGQIVEVDDLTRDERWRRYRPHAIARGVVSSLSLPLAVDGQVVAALNLYAKQAGAFHEPARQHAEAFAAQCAAALALTLRQADQADLHQQLNEAMTSRSVIDQAIGILMGQQRCNATTAFDLLRQASQHRNRKLRDVAVEIITNVTGEPPQPPADFEPGNGPRSPRR
jgi:GAF domain-containing protein